MIALLSKLKIYGPQKFFSYALIDLKNKIMMQMIKKSYSQKGEDLIIDRLLNKKKKGFYVDVGAYDPDRFSNTKKFYNRGWRGINIEPDENNFNKFMIKRRKDINLNIGIGNKASSMIFYKFIPDTLSTFSKKTADNYKMQGYNFLGESKIKVNTLSEIFLKHVGGKEIDVLSIDAEGFDLQVLEGNNWKKFKPKLICIESVDHDITGGNKKERKDIHNFLIDKGYEKKFDNSLNSIYVLKN